MAIRGRLAGAVARSVAALVAMAPVMSGCPSDAFFVCDADQDCRGEGNGACQPNGFCAFPDSDCPTGLRYGEAAGGGFAGDCVDTSAATESGTSTTTTNPATTEDTTTGTGTTVPLSTGQTTGAETETPGAESTVGPGSTSTATGTATTTDATSTGMEESTGTPGCELVFEDPFNGPKLSSYWSVSSGGGSVTVDGGHLVMDVTSDENDAALRLSGSDAYPIEGLDFRVQIAADATLPTGVNFVTLLWGDEGLAGAIALTENGIRTRRYGMSSFEELEESTIDPDSVRYYRMRYAAGNLFAGGSLDGQFYSDFDAPLFPPGEAPSMVSIEFRLQNTALTTDGTSYAIENVSVCITDP